MARRGGVLGAGIYRLLELEKSSPTAREGNGGRKNQGRPAEDS